MHEKKRGRKVYILVAFSESFPTTYNMPTCDEPTDGVEVVIYGFTAYY